MEMKSKEEIRDLVAEMLPEEKAALCSGADDWNTVAIDRLGIEACRVSDGPHGLRMPETDPEKIPDNHNMQAVSFPAECLSAASFDRKLLRQIGETLGKECQARGVQVLLGPGVNIKRSPLCGRNFEYFSEDPLLAGEMASAYVQGIQSEGVGACMKHYLANSQETRRTTISSEVDERTLREIYLPAFERTVKKAQPWAVMASYNRINGTYATENREYLTDVLRYEWGFDGCVMSDWGATHNRVKAVEAGCDLTMPSAKKTNAEIVEAMESGELEEILVNEACVDVLNMAQRGLSAKRGGKFDYEKDHNFCRRAAEESAVLLKNEDGVLPLERDKSAAFIGKFAVAPRYQGGGSSCINTKTVTSVMDLAEGMEHITYAPGYDGIYPDEKLIAEAEAAAKEADVAVIFAGLPANMETEGIDREHMCMPESHNALIAAVAKVQPNTVVVLYNGSPVEMPWADSVKGILEMYLPGEAVGEATMDLLYGDANPSGRLPETFPKRLEDNPSYLFYGGSRNKVEYREGVFVGYRYYESKKMDVLFPFGHGLSYTTFACSNLKLDREEMIPGELLTVTVDVTNTGDRAGKDVVQLYVAVKECEVPRPVKELRGFEKILLAPGETKTVTFTLDKRDFSYWNDEAHCFHMPEGVYEIQIGASAHEVLLSQEIRAKEEPLNLKITYDMTSLIGDVVKKPSGAAFLDSHLEEMVQGVIASGIAADTVGEMPDLSTMDHAQLSAMTKGMYGQTLSTLQMFLPGVQDFEWAQLLSQLNEE